MEQADVGPRRLTAVELVQRDIEYRLEEAERLREYAADSRASAEKAEADALENLAIARDLAALIGAEVSA